MEPIRLTYEYQQEAPVIIYKVPPDLTTRVQNIAVCQKNAFQSEKHHNRCYWGQPWPMRTVSAPLRGRLRLKCDGTPADNTFRLSAKRTSPFKSAEASVQSTTGSRGVRISGSNAGYTTFRGSVKSTGYPLHSPASPSLPLLCVTVCHHISTGLYQRWGRPHGFKLAGAPRSKSFYETIVHIYRTQKRRF